MRFLAEEVQVEMREEEGVRRPAAFRRGGSRQEVTEVLASWGGPGFATGRNPWKGASRTYYRVRTGDGAVYELAHELDPRRRKGSERWLLHRQLSGPKAQPAPEPPAAAPARRRVRPARSKEQIRPGPSPTGTARGKGKRSAAHEAGDSSSG